MYLFFKNSHRHTQVRHRAGVVWFASPVDKGENRSLQVMLFFIDNTKCSTQCLHRPYFGVSFSQVYLCVGLAVCWQLSGPVHHKQTWADALDSEDFSFRFIRNIIQHKKESEL